MRVLVINAGSSSVKFCLCDVPGRRAGTSGGMEVAVRGSVSGLNGTPVWRLRRAGSMEQSGSLPGAGHEDAFRWLFDQLREDKAEAVGHRVVHGGERFHEPVPVDEAVEAALEPLNELAPLHNPACLAGIRAARHALGRQFPMVAVFDTAFHRTLPAAASRYALPDGLVRRHGVMRYGFHGIAHFSMARQYASHAGRTLAGTRLITFQLGNGCSVTAIKDGQSVETSMGFSPLEGLVMGTRCGDLDPAIVGYLARREGVDQDQVERWLNEQSGLLGLSGLSSDMEVLLRAAADTGHEGAKLAVDVFCHRARKYLGAYLAVLGGADAVIFGGGIGERAPAIRARICEGFEWGGLRLNQARNASAVAAQPGVLLPIGADGSPMQVFVAGVDEEAELAVETVRCLESCRAG
jgi:acetate kinase